MVVIKILRDCVTYCEHGNRKTVTVYDVIHSLQRIGKPIYGVLLSVRPWTLCCADCRQRIRLVDQLYSSVHLRLGQICHDSLRNVGFMVPQFLFLNPFSKDPACVSRAACGFRY